MHNGFGYTNTFGLVAKRANEYLAGVNQGNKVMVTGQYIKWPGVIFGGDTVSIIIKINSVRREKFDVEFAGRGRDFLAHG